MREYAVFLFFTLANAFSPCENVSMAMAIRSLPVLRGKTAEEFEKRAREAEARYKRRKKDPFEKERKLVAEILKNAKY